MEKTVVIIETALICAVSFWLMIRDLDTKWPPEELPKAKKGAYIFGAIAVLITICISVLLVTLYSDNDIWTNLRLAALLSTIWPIAYIDLKTMRIPNSFIILGLICRALILPFEFLMGEERIWTVLLSEGVAAAALLVASLLCTLLIKNSIGFGDMKLFVVMGLFLGMDGIWSAVFLSLIASFVIAVTLLIAKKKTKKDAIPFGPAIVLGTFLSVCLTGM